MSGCDAEANCLYLVPADILAQWRGSQSLQAIDKPLDSEMSRVNKEHSDAVNASPDQSSTYDRSITAQQTLGKLLQVKNLRHKATTSNHTPSTVNVGQPTTQPVTSSPELDLSTIPKSYRNKAKSLLTKWRDSGDISWDDVGVASIRHEPIQGSSITRLLHDAVTRRRKATRPVGFAEFRKYSSENPSVSSRDFNNPAWTRPRTTDESPRELTDFTAEGRPLTSRYLPDSAAKNQSPASRYLPEYDAENQPSIGPGLGRFGCG